MLRPNKIICVFQVRLNFKTGTVGLKMFITYFIKSFYLRIMRSMAKQENPLKLGIFGKPKTPFYTPV